MVIKAKELLNEIESKALLKEAGINVCETQLARSKEEAVTLSEQTGFPVVMKTVSPEISHKSDAGGVRLNLKNAAEVEINYECMLADVSRKFPEVHIEGVAIQPMLPGGTEVILGMTNDSQFGPVLMFGLGGIWVELLKDVSLRVVPVNRMDAAEMIKEIKGYKLLTGFRGQPAVNIPVLEEMLVNLSRFVQAHPEIQEIDLNPVMVYPDRAVAADARIILKTDANECLLNEKKQSNRSLDSLFYPESVAVIGASNNPTSRGYDFMQHLINFKYQGQIYPINLKSPEVMGIKAYPTLDAIPGTVDHVIYCIGLENMPAFLDSAVKKGVKSIHVFSARGAETGRADSKALELEVKTQAKQLGIRLLGPNCMGIYCPESGFSFCADFPKEKGNVGAIIQSGGSSTDIARHGALRGLRFSKLVSYGNAIDINEMDLLKYMADDPETRVVLMFIEGLRGDGKDFLELLRETTAKKPVIICKGGLSRAGARATLSHTASLAGSPAVWETAIRQVGGIPVRDIDDLVNMAVAFSLVPPIRGRRIGTGGTGGGRNTVSVDQWETNGFEVVPLPQSIREEFKKRGAMLWDCLDNPADRSIVIPGDAYTVQALLAEMSKDPNYDFICANTSFDDHPYNRETFVDWISSYVEGCLKAARESPKPFFLIFSERPLGNRDLEHWFWKEGARLKTRAIEEKVAFFPSVDKAAQAIHEQINYYQRKDKLTSEGWLKNL